MYCIALTDIVQQVCDKDLVPNTSVQLLNYSFHLLLDHARHLTNDMESSSESTEPLTISRDEGLMTPDEPTPPSRKGFK
jgi:hypothetical protein